MREIRTLHTYNISVASRGEAIFALLLGESNSVKWFRFRDMCYVVVMTKCYGLARLVIYIDNVLI